MGVIDVFYRPSSIFLSLDLVKWLFFYSFVAYNKYTNIFLI